MDIDDGYTRHLRERLERWRGAGLLDPDQVDPILASDRGGDDDRSWSRREDGPEAVEVVTYAGAILSVVALAFVYTGGVGKPGGVYVSTAFLGAAASLAWYLRGADSPSMRRAGTAAQAVCVVATAIFATQVWLEPGNLTVVDLSTDQSSPALLVGAIAAAVVGLGFLIWRGSSILAVCVSVAMLSAGSSLLDLIHRHLAAFSTYAVWIPTGGLLLGLGEGARRLGHGRAREVFAAFGVSIPILATVWDPGLWLEAVGILAALVGLAAAVAFRSLGIAIGTAISLLVGVLGVETQFYATLAFPLSLLGLGLGLLAASGRVIAHRSRVRDWAIAPTSNSSTQRL